MPFTFHKLKLDGLILCRPKIFPDNRGYFLELLKHTDFLKEGISFTIRQINYSISHKGVIRGLHFQAPPMAQAKLITVISGAIYDVVVDIRQGSPTYGKWIAVTLTEKDGQLLYVPEGFAHGFCSLKSKTRVVYFCSREYSPKHEHGILWDDPILNIRWPVKTPRLSTKDKGYPNFRDLQFYFRKKQ